jgi:hypothetical protein
MALTSGSKILIDEVNDAVKAFSVSGKTVTFTRLDGTTGTFTTQDTNTTYSNMTAATADAAGKAGLVPAPAKGYQTRFLRGDGTWVVPTNTTYSNMTAATASAAGKAGLVPAPAAGANTKFLRGDATWQTINGSNAKAYVTETYSSGANWYRKYSDGWIEQGGTGTFGHNTTFSLVKAFTKTTYQVLIITTMEDSHWMISAIKPTTSNFTTIVYWSTNHGTSTSVTGHWYACGY